MSTRTPAEYLVAYGQAGDFSRFRSASEVGYQRGDRVLVRSPHGLEVGVVLCPATPAHAQYLSERATGELLRPLTDADEAALERLRQQGQRIFADAHRLAREFDLPLEVLDVEVLFDGRQAVLHHVRREGCDYRPLVSTLAKRHDILVIMNNLALPVETGGDEHGCGKPDCGRSGGGGCSSCGTGGCSSGSCSAGMKQEEVTAYLAGLRQSVGQPARTPLL